MPCEVIGLLAPKGQSAMGTDQDDALLVPSLTLRTRVLNQNRQFVGSIMVPGEETVFCLLDGSEADVRVAGERAELPFERVLASLRIDGGEQ